MLRLPLARMPERMSRLAGVALLLWMGASASAEAQVPPASSPPPASAAEKSPAEMRHRLGLQIGATGFLQLAYRYRVAGPVHLDTGAFGVPHGLNVSLGVVVAVPVGDRWFPYFGLGGGLASAAGPKVPDGCDPDVVDCSLAEGSDVLTYLHARAGVGLAFGGGRRHMLALDVGSWYGIHHESETDGMGVTGQTSARFTWPMAGLAYFYAF